MNSNDILMNESNPAEGLRQYLTFIVDKEEYGVDILRVMEIRSWEEPTVIPESPGCIKGVINLRGIMVPIIDLRERFGIPRREYDKFTVVIVVQIEDNSTSENKVLGLVVDAVSEVCTANNDQHKPVPDTALKSGQDYINALVMHGDKTVIILDCVQLIADKSALNNIIQISKPTKDKIMEKSLFDRLGGSAAVDAAVDLFYNKVLADTRINDFFKNTDMEKQKRMQKSFLTMAFGGPNTYNGRGMRAAHEKAVANGLNDSHFDAVMENLGATLTELGVSGDDIAEAAKIAESVRTDVLNK